MVVGAKEACLSWGDVSLNATVYLCDKLAHFSDQILHCYIVTKLFSSSPEINTLRHFKEVS